MPDRIDDDHDRDDDATRAVARLPGLEIEVTHRRSPDAEQIAIYLQAMPSFEAFGEYLEAANPFALWARAAQLVWSPWLSLFPWANFTRALSPPRADETPPTVPE